MRRLLLGSLVLLLPVTTAAAQDAPLTDPSRWTFSQGSGGRIVTEGGEPVLHLPSGFVNLAGTTFSDGTISFEVRHSGRPSFVGFRFREGGGGAENVYVRPQKSGEWDAVQYQPILNGSSTWQLHSGEGYTAAAWLPASEWIPVRLDVRGDQAELRIGDATEPTMRIALERGVTSGTVSFNGAFRGQAPEGVTSASFRRIRIDSRAPTVMASAMRATTAAAGFIRNWRVSEPMAVEGLPVTELPSAARSRSVAAEGRGLVNLSRHFARIQGARHSTVVAEATLTADRARRVALAFDYSDDVSVFLNGQLLFSGVNGWESRYGFYLGNLDPTNPTQSVWLDLRAGSNTLSFVVSETNFGWGFFATLGTVTGVTVAP